MSFIKRKLLLGDEVASCFLWEWAC